jgi:hypothetical protein
MKSRENRRKKQKFKLENIARVKLRKRWKFKLDYIAQVNQPATAGRRKRKRNFRGPANLRGIFLGLRCFTSPA